MPTTRPGIADPKNVLAGVLFMALGGASLLVSSDYRMGTALHMGPGYYPFAVGLLLLAVGAGTVLRGLVHRGDALGLLPWRPALAVTAAVLLFAVSVDRIGLAPAVVLSVLVAALAKSPLRLVELGVLAAVLCAASVLVFFYGLRLPFRVWG